MNIYVGNLSYSVNEYDLREIFEEYGEVTSVKIINDRDTGRSKGFGFVEMANDDEAKAAMEELNEAELEGRPLKVNQARERTQRRDFNRGGYGNNRGGYRKDYDK